MPINLKEILITDTDNIKLDKINYNFDQIVANGGGPAGSQGPRGDLGLQGITGATGYQGLQGPMGNQGFQGPAGASYWKEVTGPFSNTLIPIHSTEVGTPAPSLSIGFASNDAEYNSSNDSSIWKINRKSSQYQNNIQLTEDSFAIQGNVRVSKNLSTGVGKMFIGLTSSTDTEIHFFATRYVFKNTLSTTESVVFDEISATFNVDATFNNDATFNSPNFRINTGTPDVDKIAASQDSTGKVVWKTAAEVGGVAPIGTIISILPAVFTDDDNFLNSYTEVMETHSPLRVRAGAGIDGYAGWYLCNGKTWRNADNSISYTVPDLNSFSYTIIEDGGSTALTSQGGASVTNDTPNLIGGADIAMDANYVAGSYVITQTVQTSKLQVGTSTGTDRDVYRLPQIIYLGESDLYWVDPGTGQAPITNVTYNLIDNNTTASKSDTVIESSSEQLGSSFTISTEISAPAGYYWSSLPTFNLPVGGEISDVVPSINYSNNTVLSVIIYVSSQPADGSVVNITYDSTSAKTVIPNFTISLVRNSSPSNVLSITPSSTVTGITYNSQTGYTFDIVLTAVNNYGWSTVNDVSFTSGTTPAGATFTVNSRTFTGLSSGFAYNNRQLTMNVTLTGLTSASTVNYGLQGNAVLLADPVDLTVNSGAYPITNTSLTYPNVNITNNTSSTVYIKLGAVYYGGGGGSVSVSSSGEDFTNLYVTNSGTNAAWSSNYVTLAAGDTYTAYITSISGVTANFSIYWGWSSSTSGTPSALTS